LPGVPVTMLVSEGGKVEQVWGGAYFEDTRAKIEKHFAVRFENSSADIGR
jgi:hypothetical protein